MLGLGTGEAQVQKGEHSSGIQTPESERSMRKIYAGELVSSRSWNTHTHTHTLNCRPTRAAPGALCKLAELVCSSVRKRATTSSVKYTWLPDEFEHPKPKPCELQAENPQKQTSKSRDSVAKSKAPNPAPACWRTSPSMLEASPFGNAKAHYSQRVHSNWLRRIYTPQKM